MINAFLQSKDQNLSISHTVVGYRNLDHFEFGGHQLPDNSTRLTTQRLHDEFKSIFDDGNQIRVSLAKDDKRVVRFFNMDGSLNITTNTWKEGGGHSVFVTDVLDDGLEVSSWGERLFISFEDFIGNQFGYQYGKILGIGE